MHITPSFVAAFSKALHEAQIPCCLWSYYLLSVFSIPSIIGSIDFVIPDHLLTRAESTLSRFIDLTPCPDPLTCSISCKTRRLPPPATHMHYKLSEIGIGLYVQSETLWFLPSLDATLLPPFTNLQLSYVVGSDTNYLPPFIPELGQGAFPADEYPVLVPKPHIVLEAFMRIYARDLGVPQGGFAMSQIDYMELYVDAEGYLNIGELPKDLQSLYIELKQGETPVRQWGEKLQNILSSEANQCRTSIT